MGLYFLRARYLDVSTGRFWTQDRWEGDSESPNSLHKYLYTANDPINSIDPSGNSQTDIATTTATPGLAARIYTYSAAGALRVLKVTTDVLMELAFETFLEEVVGISFSPADLIIDAVSWSIGLAIEYVSNKPKDKKKNHEFYERFGSKKEAEDSAAQNKLLPKPGHERQPKWIAEIGLVKYKNLGNYQKYYTHRMVIETYGGAREWLKQFEIKPTNEPGRYAIPAEYLDTFNTIWVHRITAIKL